MEAVKILFGILFAVTLPALTTIGAVFFLGTGHLERIAAASILSATAIVQIFIIIDFVRSWRGSK